MVDYTQFGRYRITPNGEVYGLNGKRMKTIIDKDGYEVVGLRDDRRKKYLVKVHRLVATRFIPTDDFSLTVNHKNGDRLNNSVDNLEWMTNSQNLQHSWRTLKRKHYTKPIINSKGEQFSSAKEAAKKYGVGIQTISNCATGKTKTSMGLKWRYL